MKPQLNASVTAEKMASILLFLMLFYVLPLFPKPGLIVRWQIIFLSVICSVLFATQPRLSIKESKKHRGTDRHTVWIIIAVTAIGQITSVIEWAYFSPTHKRNNIWIVAGAILLIAGTAFRLYAIHILGKLFTSTVQIKKEHQIVTAGPYKFLRHPSYTGAYAAMLGSAIFLHSISGILIFGAGMFFVYHLRIKAEERSLIAQFKKEYLEYCKHTYRMIPFIW